MKRAIVCAAILASAAVPGFAMDLGTQGAVWPIREVNPLIEMLSRMADIDWQAKNRAIVREQEERLDNLPDAGLSAAPKTKTLFYDITLTLQDALQAPVKQDDGSIRWQVVYPAGTKVNPLEKITPPTRLLVFNARDAKQLAFARKVLAAWPDLVEPMLTGGGLRKLAKELDRPVYYATPPLVRSFRLRAVPALIGVGAGTKAKYLAVTEFGPDQLDPALAVQTVRDAWYGLETGSVVVSAQP
ncbi:MAG: hypothetical protein QJR02_01955 [Sinobacteraceae bacterium]|nr:hypothetical protein [Nevskiaceae bacterium]